MTCLVRKPESYVLAAQRFACCVVVCLALLTAGRPCPANPAEPASSAADYSHPVREGFLDDHAKICSFGSRFPGQQGEQQTAAFIEQTLREAGVEHVWKQPFEMAVPVADDCTLQIDDSDPVPMYPVWPNGANPSTLPTDGLKAEAVYVGKGNLADLPVDLLAGRIAVMEFDSGDRWRLVAMYGAVAVVFLQPETMSWSQAHAKFSHTTVPLPRFYVKDAEAIEQLRSAKRLELNLSGRVRWQRIRVHNILGLIPGSDPEHRKTVAVLHSRYDGCAVVPELAYGAEQAINPAVALQISQRLAVNPPAYSVLVAFVTGDSFELTGSRRLMKTLTGTQHEIGQDLSEYESTVQRLQSYRAALQNERFGQAITGWDQRELRNDHILWQVKLRQTRIMDRLKRLRLASEKAATEAEAHDIAAREQALTQRRVRLLGLQQRLHHDALTGDDLELLRELLPDVIGRINRMIEDARFRLETHRVDMSIMKTLGLGEYRVGDYSRGILFTSLELSSHSTGFGPFAQSYMCDQLIQKQLTGKDRYGPWLARCVDELDVSEPVRDAYQADTTEGRRHWQSELPFPVVNGIDAAVSGGCMGFMLATTQDMRPWIDTPMDTIQRIDFDNLMPQVELASALLLEVFSRPMPTVGSRLPRKFWRWEGMAAVGSPGEAQLELGLPDVLIYARSFFALKNLGVRGIGVRDMVAYLTDAQGRYAVDDVMDIQLRRESPLRPEAYSYDSQGHIVKAMDSQGRWDKPITGHPRQIDRLNLSGEMFDCRQIALYGLYDTRYLEDLDRIEPIEAARGSVPRSFFSVVDDGLASLFLPTDVARWQIVFAKGDASRRMLLINASDKSPEGIGYGYDWRQKSPLVYTSAQDFSILNQHRIQGLEDTGVIDPFLQQAQEESVAEAEKARSARQRGDAAASWRHSTRALNMQAEVYHRTRQAADDTIHAVLFLLVGLVPFSYFLERLILGSTHVYRQIGGFVAIFVAMVILVGAFHPAFRITMTPVTILLAFIILFLSSLVILIVIGKFRRELEILREMASALPTEQEIENQAAPDPAGSADDFKRMDVLHRAMLLGVANMRRRKVRTALTLATLVLLSFVIMSFTNPVTQSHPLHYDLADNADIQQRSDAVFVQRLSYRQLPSWTIEHLQTAYQDRADVVGHYWITLNRLRNQHRKHLKISAGQQSELLSAISCVTPQEIQALQLDRIFGDASIAGFVEHENSVMMSDKLAARLGVTAGDHVTMFGRSFQVVGVGDQRKMLGIVGFNGQTYAPVDFMQYSRFDPTRVQEQIDMMEAAETSTDMMSAATAERFTALAPDQFVIIRAAQGSELGATLRGVLLLPHDSQTTMQLADELASRVRRPVYANSQGRVLLCAAAEITSVSGLGNVIVPLLISALIIFNTMLNCVYERQREIGILMSVGLAPAHVGALFVAEAAAYGTIGVVGGYVLGQGLGTFVSTYDLIPGMTLNFSSQAAMYTQLAIMVVVILSSLWPAWRATRIAAPGSESSWKLPVPEGDIMTVDLPFTMHGRDAEAVLAFLRDWLATHTEASLGHFCTGTMELFQESESAERGLVAQVWLAPFDLGIMQTIELTIVPGDDPTIHEVRIELRREAGPHSVWGRSNRRFLIDMRKQFLLWRSVKPHRKEAYRQSARMTFAQLA
jgi:hypothetical protein